MSKTSSIGRIDGGPLEKPKKSRQKNIEEETAAPEVFVARPMPEVPSLPREVPFVPQSPRRSSRYGIWYIAGFCVVGLLFALSFLFEYAHVAITPKSEAVVLDAADTFTGTKDGDTANSIVYTVMAVSDTESLKLPATDQKLLSEKATGKVMLYNTHSTSVYTLVKGTRLETPDKKIYRINEAAKIPGYTKNGTEIIPGSIEVTVTADVAGDAGNHDMTDFTVPGLAGTAQATKIYGRSKTDISGGVSGTMYTVEQSTADAALGMLKEKLKTSLLSKTRVQVPDGYIFFEGAIVFSSNDTVAAPYSKEDEVPIELSGTLTAYVFEEDSLTRAIAQKFVSQYDGEAAHIPELSNFVLTPTAPLSPTTESQISFSLSGTGSVVWDIDTAGIKDLLVAKKKASFDEILSGMSSIEKAEVTIKPFWKGTFPKDAKRINVTIQ